MRRKTFFIIIVLTFFIITQRKTYAEQVFHFDTQVTTRTSSLTSKPMFPFALPSGQSAVSLDGYVETKADSRFFSEALISLHVSTSSACPAKGEDLHDYPQINAHFPSITLAAIIVKQASIGVQRVPVHFRWVPPVPLNQCLFVVMDGSDFVGKPYMMKTHLTLTTNDTEKSIKPEIVGVLADEFLMSPQKHETAYKVYHVLRNMNLTGLYGNVAAVAVKGVVNRPPSGYWKAIHSVYILHNGCPQFPHDGMYTDNPELDKFIFDKETEKLASVTLYGMKSSSSNSPFAFHPEKAVELHPGDCVIHGVLSYGPPGPRDLPADGINTESQIGMEVMSP